MQPISSPVTIFWHRRDLRTFDNAGLLKALKADHPVLPVFIFDATILGKLEDRRDRRVLFIHQELQRLKKEYQAHGSDLLVYYGKPLDVWKALLNQFNIAEVYTNRDYEPYARERDEAVLALLDSASTPFKGGKDHVIFEKNEVVKADGTPYTVFTPYMKRWKEHLASQQGLESHPSELHFQNLKLSEPLEIPSLASMGFESIDFEFPERDPNIDVICKYDTQRDIPAVQGTSRLSLHLRFGTVSIRALARIAQKNNEKWLNELIWRDFYQMILYHFPHSATQAFRAKYDNIPWRNSTDDFERWCAGTTGYPIVDAGMRELSATGFMHNRVRMVTASFLTKHLLLDWRLGERYFAAKLLDFDLASNVGGWQWAAGSGCDAAPYFRVFNPTAQQEKFDPQARYIKKWVPEYGTPRYPAPMVEHAFARKRAIDTYKEALG
jgi:deoxyribodipyrimidine photo-lyase